MFRDLKPYERYGASPGAWMLGMPDHWQTMPGAAVLKPVRARNIGLIVSTVLSLSYGRVIVKPPEKLRGLVPESFETYQILEPGDIVVRPTDLQNDKTSLRVGHVRDRGIITSAYLGFRACGINDAYAFAYLAALDHMKIFYGMGSGLRQNLDLADFKRLPVAVPPAEEQAAIVKYLGHAHASIDRAIAAKRKLIALLEEQKQAIIHQALSRGLDPSVPVKGSGIPWLGEIPAHWTVHRLKSMISAGPTNGVSPQITEDGALETFSLSAVRDGVLDIRPNDLKYVADASVPRKEDYRLRAGDILLVRGNGNLELVGRAAEVTEDRARGIFPDLLIRVRPNPENNPRYLTMSINSRSARNQLEVEARTAVGTFKISGRVVKNLRLPRPPLREQRDIVHEIEARTTGVRASISAARREIELLREFRTRLTSDVVTGQVDVRDTAAMLPELSGDDSVPELDDELAELLDAELEAEGVDD